MVLIIILIAVVFVAGLLAGGLIWTINKNNGAKEHSDILENVRVLNGLEKKNLIQKQAEEKRINKERVLKIVAAAGRISNNDIEKELNVSDATAERYLQELEEEGKIRQIGEKGGYIYYEFNGSTDGSTR